MFKNKMGHDSMKELNQIKVEPKTGNEELTVNGNQTGYKLLDFWRWSVSDLISNATRGRFAEFIVATALGISTDGLREEWEAWDLTTKSSIKIEVKSSAYIQSWGQRKLSAITFSIRKASSWESETTIKRGEAKRHADLYVFCHLKHKDQNTIDPLKMEQWDFYVVPTFKLDSKLNNQKTIRLSSLRELASPIGYNELKSAVQKEYKEQSQFE